MKKGLSTAASERAAGWLYGPVWHTCNAQRDHPDVVPHLLHGSDTISAYRTARGGLEEGATDSWMRHAVRASRAAVLRRHINGDTERAPTDAAHVAQAPAVILSFVGAVFSALGAVFRKLMTASSSVKMFCTKKTQQRQGAKKYRPKRNFLRQLGADIGKI